MMETSDEPEKLCFVPLQRSKRGRSSAIPNEEFLKLFQKHAPEIKSYGKMIPLNHMIISDFAATLNASRQCVYLKIEKYAKATIFEKRIKPSTPLDSEEDKKINYNQENKLDDDIQTIKIGAYTSPYNEFIKEICIYPELKIVYYSHNQLEWYNRYSNLEYAFLSIDLIGGIIQSSG